MAVSLIEIGIPLFNKIKSCSPALAKDLSRKRYTYQLRPRAQERLEDYAEDEAGKHRLDAILGFALPHQEKERIRGEARRSGRKMSAIARERIGVKA
jgi:hypothetical protein